MSFKYLTASEWEREEERAGEGSSDGGGERPTSGLHTSGRAKGPGAVCSQPRQFPSSAGGYGSPELGEVSFRRPVGGWGVRRGNGDCSSYCGCEGLRVDNLACELRLFSGAHSLSLQTLERAFLCFLCVSGRKLAVTKWHVGCYASSYLSKSCAFTWTGPMELSAQTFVASLGS